MTQSNILFIDMDVHKESIVALLADDDRNEVRRYPPILSNAHRLLLKGESMRKIMSDLTQDEHLG